MAGPALRTCRPPSSGPNTQRHLILSLVFYYGAQSRRKVPLLVLLSVFPPQPLSMKTLLTSWLSTAISHQLPGGQGFYYFYFIFISFEAVLWPIVHCSKVTSIEGETPMQKKCVWAVKLSCRIYSWCRPEPWKQGFWIRKGDILFSLSLILGLYRNSRCFPATKCTPMSTFLYWASHVKRVKFKAAAHGEGIQIHGKSAQYGIFYGEF